MPILSVVMPVYNALPYLDAAIESVLAQSFGDFHFLIRDDASTDGSTERLRYWAERDSRIALFEGDTQLGPVGSSDWIARKAETPLVARMDADDIASPDWLAVTYRVLQEFPDVVLAGSLYNTIDHDGRLLRKPERWRIVRRSVYSPFSHSSIMYRRETFEAIGGYRENTDYWEDFDLYARFADVGQVAVICSPLNNVRHSQTSARLVSKRDQVEQAVDLMYYCLEAYRNGKDYSDLLARADEIRQFPEKRPETLFSYASNLLRSGGRPHILWQMLTKTKLTWSKATVKSLIWATWCELSPRSLLGFLHLLGAFRNRVFARDIKDGQIFQWEPRSLGKSALLKNN